jgi:glycosyltransferase involved in cell wall biosynthesis
MTDVPDCRSYRPGDVHMLVSVIVPTRNRPESLARLIAAFSTIPDIEVIVIDDASDREISGRNHTTVSSAHNARYERLEKRSGGCAARNTGVALATGEYLWFVDDDDYVPPHTADGVVARLSKSESPDMIALRSRYVGDNGVLAEYVPTPHRDNFNQYRNRGQLVSLPSLIIKRALFDVVGGWDNRLPAAQDTDLLLRLSQVAAPVCWSDLEVQIHVGHAGRVTNHVLRQQRAKLLIVAKHWRVLTWRRRWYYIATLLMWMPLIRRFTGRLLSRELTNSNRRSGR